MRIKGLAVAMLLPAGFAQGQEVCGRYPVPQPSYSCICDTVNVTGAVWGSGPYTADSDVCTAALHAGVIGRDGGPIEARLADGQKEYAESSANGVSTQRWGRYDSSFEFDAPSKPANTTEKPKLPVFKLTEKDTKTVAEGSEEVCTGLDFDAVETVCRCEPGQGTAATLWGSGPYAAGSDLCAAARHAEVIGLDGGVISVIRMPGLTSYRGSERGGIKSGHLGENSESFVVNAN